MSLAIFHSADYHVGAYRWVPNYLERTRIFLQDLLDTVVAHPATEKILVIAGDFWDRTDLTEAERLLGTYFVTSVLRAGVHIVETLGNHEFVDERGLTLIHPYSHWASIVHNYHVVAGKPQVVTIQTTASGPVQFFCLPCTQQRDTADVIRSVAALREEAGPKLGLRYVIIHEAITSARSARGEEIRVPKTLAIEEDPDIDGYMLGDIHMRQKFGSKTWYCGSPIQVKRDENPDTGILLWAGSDVTVLPLDAAPKFKVTTSVQDVQESIASERADIVLYVGSDKLEDVASLPKNIIVDPNYAAVDVSEAVGGIVSSECRSEAVDQLPAFLAALGHDADDQLEGVSIVLETIDRLGIA